MSIDKEKVKTFGDLLSLVEEQAEQINLLQEQMADSSNKDEEKEEKKEEKKEDKDEEKLYDLDSTLDFD